MKLCMLIHVNIVYRLPCITKKFDGRGFASKNAHNSSFPWYNWFKLCILMYFNIGMQKGDEASPSIILVGRALLVKMHMTLEAHGIFGSNFIY